MNRISGKGVWVVPKLEKIEMAQTQVVTGGCSAGAPGSKTMAGNENLANNCSVGS